MPPHAEPIDEHRAKSSLGQKYPSLRDDPTHSPDVWLQGKRLDDGAEGLWRIHNGLYNLASFIAKHPGGSSWLELTKGTDITEAFEVHHTSLLAEKMLPKYFVRNASTPRNSPFTFAEDGFYRTLKRNVRPLLKELPKKTGASKMMIDSLFVGTFLLSIIAAGLRSYLVATAAGIFLTWTVIAAHNFFHQKDNFRMYYFNLGFLSAKEWRISHALSHHLFTNTINDLEISFLEPFFQYLPTEKSLLIRYGSWLYSPIIYLATYFVALIRRLIRAYQGHIRIELPDLIPFALPLVMYLVSRAGLVETLKIWLVIVAVGSFHFTLVGLNAAHHHPKIFHDGDIPRPERDWGLMQLDAVVDRHEISGNSFLVLTNFGDHALHHMFPTIDHGTLLRLYPVFHETCKQFNTELQMKSQLELILGQFKQLARIVPKTNFATSKLKKAL